MRLKLRTTAFLVIAALVSACSETDAPEPQQPLDPAAIEANNRGVGLMGRFQYPEALAVFSEIVEQRPEWNDARVNLAIATLNRQQPGDELRARDIVRGVLASDPDHLRARYVSGLIDLYLGDPEAALPEFERVAEADPEDGHAAYYLAQCMAQLSRFEEALSWYRRAMAKDPYLRSAYYGAFQVLQRLGRAEEANSLVAQYERLENNPRSYLAEFRYTRMGTRGEARAVSLPSGPAGSAPTGSLFEPPAPLPIRQPGELHWRTATGERPPSLTTTDLQGDGLPDLLLTGAVDRIDDDGQVSEGNLVLAGTADGGYAALGDHPLASVDRVNAALWGDYDNDGRVDVYLCRDGPNQLWRQAGDGDWRDVTASTGTAGGDLDTIDGAIFDADHDGDLDLFLVNADGPNELLNNNLDGTFRPLAGDFGLQGSSVESFQVLPADLDGDRDVDLVVLNRTTPHDVYINDRLWSYRPADGYDAFRTSPALAVLAADSDADGRIELYSIGTAGELIRWQADDKGEINAERLAAPDILANSERAQLAASDVDGDGAPELIVSVAGGWAVFSTRPGSDAPLHRVDRPAGDELLAALPYIGRSLNGPAMLTYSAGGGALAVAPPGPGRYPFVTLTLSGRQVDAESMRSNASGIGAQLAVRSGSRWSILEHYRHQSGPGQSLQPLAVGLAGAPMADFIAIDWSDGVFQSEVGLAAGEVHHVTETQRQLSSCPVLFAWNGEEFAFVSDFLGVGGMGYAIGPGQYTTPRPWEFYLFPDGAVKARQGRYQLKIGEPMEENAYIDSVHLSVYDLPPGWQMVMDERMGISPPEPTGEARFYRHEMLPVSARNDRGEDVLPSLLDTDGAAAPVGHLDTRFIGRLEQEHVLTLEFPQSPDEHPGAPMLVIDGWVEYPYSQTNFAAWQAGAAYEAPTLEAFDGERWRVVLEQFGYPAGMPRRMSVPLADLPPGTRLLRIRTNMQIYWDRIAVAHAETPDRLSEQRLGVAASRLGKTGFARRSNFDQMRPHYDYQDRSPFWDTRYMAGYYTRLGPVEELVSVWDDAVAIIGPGEEIHLEFDEAEPAPDGWRRFLVLETRGWAKDMDLFTRDGDTVGPLPSSGKPASPRDELHARYNTRYQAGR